MVSRQSSVGVLVAALAVTAMFVLTVLKAVAQNAPLPAVIVAPAEMSDLRPSVGFTGRAVATQRVEVRPRVAGFLEEIAFNEGAMVSAGDLLYRIEDGNYSATVDQINASIAAAEAELRLAQIEVERQTTLLERDTVAQSAVDVAEANEGKAQGQVDQLKAQLERAELELSYTRITAPFDGVIGLSNVDVGAFVEPSTGPLTTLIRLDPMTVEFPVPSALLLSLRTDLDEEARPEDVAVTLELPDGSTYSETGLINFLDAQVSAGTDTVTARAVFPNSQGVLLDGALVGVEVEDARPQNVLNVPQTAVQRDQLGPFVMVVNSEDMVEQRRIDIERTTAGRSVIGSGLEPGELVITEGINKVRPGIKVDAAQAGAS